jgi:radical SAM superfamily enzyme YgiQ (UPF0313 family)
MEFLDIVLVNPSNKKKAYGRLADTLAGIEPPLWIGLLAGFLRESGFSVAIIDADAEDLGAEDVTDRIIKMQPLLVALGAIGSNPSAASTPKMGAIRLLMETFRERGVKARTMAFGIHPSALPERTLREEGVDCVCQGEAFYPTRDLLKVLKERPSQAPGFIQGLWRLENDKVVEGGWAKVVKNLDELPFVPWDLLPMEKYRAHNWHCFGHINERSPYAIIYTSLGCPFHCRYCNIHALYDGKPGVRFRSPEKVAAEIDLLVKKYNVRNFKIIDELFVIKGSRLEALCDLLIERNYDLNIWAYARVDTVDEKILQKLRRAGVRWLCYGIEAGSQDVRSGVAKGRFDRDGIMKAVRLTSEAGIHVLGNFMFGLPDDTMATMQETLRLAEEINCAYSNFYVTMAYPGSLLYEDALVQGVRLPETWGGFSQFSPDTVPLPTKYLKPEEVLRFRDEAFATYHSSPKYLAMIRETFGEETVRHIEGMLQYRIPRKLLSEGNEKLRI